MAYIRPSTGIGEVVPIPLSSWGMVGSPCTLGEPASITGDPRCGSTGLPDTICGIPTTPLLIGGAIVAGLLVMSAFGKGRG